MIGSGPLQCCALGYPRLAGVCLNPESFDGGGLVAKFCLTLFDPMDYSPPRSSVRRIFQARVPEWVAIPFSRGSSWLREWTQFFLHCRQILYQLSYQGIPYWHGYLGSGSGQGWLEGHGVFLKSSSLHKDSGYQKCFAVVLPGRGFLSSPPFNQRVSHPFDRTSSKLCPSRALYKCWLNVNFEALWGWYNYYPHCTDEEAKGPGRLSNKPKITQPGSAGTKNEMWLSGSSTSVTLPRLPKQFFQEPFPSVGHHHLLPSSLLKWHLFLSLLSTSALSLITDTPDYRSQKGSCCPEMILSPWEVYSMPMSPSHHGGSGAGVKNQVH